MMYTVRFGVINSMDPDVRQIAPQNLKDNQPMSPSAQSDSINQLLKEEKSLQIQINELRKKESATTTVVQDRIKALEKRIMQVKETIDRSKVSNGVSDFDGIYRVMANARVICSTLSSAINLKQLVLGNYSKLPQLVAILIYFVLFFLFCYKGTFAILMFALLMKHLNVRNHGLW